MKFHKEIRFEAPLADVYAMLGDRGVPGEGGVRGRRGFVRRHGDA